MDRQAWWATVHRVTKSQTWLSNKAHTHTCPEKNLWMRTERREVQIDFHLEEKKKNLIVRLGLQLKKIIRILTLNILAKVIYSTFAFSQARELADCCCHSVTRSCPALCDLLDCSMPGFPVLHYFPEFAQIHVHWVSDAIQPSHPLSSPSPPALNLSQHQGLLHWVGSWHQVVRVSKFHLQHQFFQWIVRVLSFRIDWFDFLTVQRTT